MFPVKEISFKTYRFTNDVNQMDIKAIHDYLSNHSYWVQNIPFKVVEQAVKNSACFGVFDKDTQVGFARLVTDYTTFGYLMDVYILQEHRGRGLSKKLMNFILSFIDKTTFRGIMLATKDAHSLYASYGFESLITPEKFMQLKLRDYTKEI